jgi:uncharacterized membrane protein
MVLMLILVAAVFLIVLVLAWNSTSASRNKKDDASMGYSGDTTSSAHIHSDYSGHGHDGGVASGGDCGGGDGGGGSD